LTDAPDDLLRRAYAAALRRLARRDHSEQELRRALARGGHDEDAIGRVIARLRRERALDDGRVAEAFSRRRLAHHGHGRHRIRHDLQERGIARATADAGLKRALDDVPEVDIVDVLAHRYWSRRSKEPPPERMRKMWAFLLRRGFPPALVHDRLRTLWPRWRGVLDDLPPVEE
jgi:regulatory protein